MKLSYETFSFKEENEKIKNEKIIITLLKHFHFSILKEDLKKIGLTKVEENSLEFDNANWSQEKFDDLINEGFLGLTGLFSNKAIYVHKNSKIPLIGNLAFGIVDRNTDALELKPITNCNLNCTFCSVDEGKISKKTVDFVVEADYLVEETKKIVEFKSACGKTKISLHINPHGEPLLYADTLHLVKQLSNLKDVSDIVIYTNGFLLNKQLIDDLSLAGLTRLSISVHTFDKAKAEKILGANCDTNHLAEMILYAKQKLEVFLSPVYLPSINDKDIEEIILFAKKHNLVITIQNFLGYKTGRNPIKGIDFKKFFKKLEEWEKSLDTKLTLSEDKFLIKKTIALPAPFKTDELVDAEAVCEGRYAGEVIFAAKERTMLVSNCSTKINSAARLKITHSKHNIFFGELARR